MSGISKKLMQGAAGQGGEPLAIEDVFSTYLYTGNSSTGSGITQTITNEIDFTGEGGLLWIKRRDASGSHFLFDTLRGDGVKLSTDLDFGNGTGFKTNLLSDGFEVEDLSAVNGDGNNYASWSFRKAPRFFDVVTYTGDAVAGRTISHDLGIEPGCIIVKRLDGADNWTVYHRGIDDIAPEDYLIYLNTDVARSNQDLWADTAPTDLVFSVGSNIKVNGSGNTYVAYLFAHDPLGPSGDGSDGLIACGSYAGTGANDNVVTLGWEPQWILVKNATTGGTADDGWWMVDNIRGWVVGGNEKTLQANTSNAEDSYSRIDPTATGFSLGAGGEFNQSGDTYIYIAIRRGPMRAPDSGSEVFVVADDRLSPLPGFVSGFPVDFAFRKYLPGGSRSQASSRLTQGGYLDTSDTAAEYEDVSQEFDYMNGWYSAGNSGWYSWMFRRAPGFFDVVAYTGDGVQGHNVSHNLGVAPDMMIVKQRSTTFINGEWRVYVSGITHLSVFGSDPDNYGDNPAALRLDSTDVASFSSSGNWDHTHPTDTFFRLGDTYHTNRNGDPYIAYLFATLPGVSKVGSYTGNGSSQTIDCGFSSGARFILIKRTDSTGDWYVWDTARGIVAGDDPFLELNTTDPEVTTDDSIDPDGSGFVVNQTATTNINVSSGEYIFFAIA